MPGSFPTRGSREHRLETLHVAALSSFAVAQPLYDLISRSPEFLVAHRFEPVGVVLLAALLMLGPPALVVLLVRLARACYPQAARVAAGLAIAGLAATIWLPVLRRWPAAPGWQVLLAAGVIGIVTGIGYVRFGLVRLFVSGLAPGLLIFPLLFLARPPINKLLMPPRPAKVVAGAIESKTPVVVAVFDQLPLVSLLDDRKLIDPVLYPNFAKLAAEAIWFRNATTVSDRTSHALPALLSGNYPRPSLLPTAADHPGNLFELLAHRNLKVYEPLTRLCREDLCEPSRERLGVRVSTLLIDLSIAYSHLLVPADFDHLLPPIDQRWKGFAGENDSPEGRRWAWHRDRDRRRGPLQFIASIGGDDPQPTLYFLHCLLPHEPFQHLPSGQYYGNTRDLTGLLPGERWTRQPLPVDLSYLRHLLQVRYVDHLLGKLLDRLRQAGIYERSLLVVTSDHGASFRPGDLFKEPSSSNFADIMSVPLLVKLPEQTAGRIDDSNIETIDLLPTIAHALGSPLTWPTDGQSALAMESNRRPTKTIFLAGATRSLQFTPREIDSKFRSALRKYRLYDRGTSAWSWSPVFPELIGREVAHTAAGADEHLRARLHYADLFSDVDPAADFVPSFLSGYLEPAGGPPIDLAIGVNGTIRTTTRTYAFAVAGRQTGAWEALVPANVFTAGRNLVEVFTIGGSRDNPILSRVYSSRHEILPITNLALEAARWRNGVESSGFYPQEWWADRPARWTNGNAGLVITAGSEAPPRGLHLTLLHTGPRGGPLKILANGCVLFDGTVPPGGLSLALDFSACAPGPGPLKVELISNTFVPAAVDPSSNDRRPLGVAVESLRLLE